MKERYHFKGFDLVTDTLEVHVHMKTLSKRANTAHRNLQVNIMNAMLPFMPVGNTGNLARKTRAASTAALGTDIVYAAAGTGAGGVPYGNFHYHGKIMVGEKTRSPWARKHERKVVTDRALTWSNPMAAPFWFDVAWKRHGDQLIKLVQEDLEGG